MNFSEKQLVDVFEDHAIALAPFTLKRNYDQTREWALPSGKRIDLLVHGNQSLRTFWIVEAKVVADTDAIVQAWRYRLELFRQISREKGSRKYVHGYISIAAQFFKPETLFFAEQMGVGCIQISPINYGRANVNTIIPVNKIRQVHYGRMYFDFVEENNG